MLKIAIIATNDLENPNYSFSYLMLVLDTDGELKLSKALNQKL